MDVTLNRSHIQEAYEVLRQLADRRSSSPLSDKILIDREKGRRDNSHGRLNGSGQGWRTRLGETHRCIELSSRR